MDIPGLRTLNQVSRLHPHISCSSCGSGTMLRPVGTPRDVGPEPKAPAALPLHLEQKKDKLVRCMSLRRLPPKSSAGMWEMIATATRSMGIQEDAAGTALGSEDPSGGAVSLACPERFDERGEVRRSGVDYASQLAAGQLVRQLTASGFIVMGRRPAPACRQRRLGGMAALMAGMDPAFAFTVNHPCAWRVRTFQRQNRSCGSAAMPGCIWSG